MPHVLSWRHFSCLFPLNNSPESFNGAKSTKYIQVNRLIKHSNILQNVGMSLNLYFKAIFRVLTSFVDLLYSPMKGCCGHLAAVAPVALALALPALLLEVAICSKTPSLRGYPPSPTMPKP
mgnify:CR=1 FL=1